MSSASGPGSGAAQIAVPFHAAAPLHHVRVPRPQEGSHRGGRPRLLGGHDAPLCGSRSRLAAAAASTALILASVGSLGIPLLLVGDRTIDRSGAARIFTTGTGVAVLLLGFVNRHDGAVSLLGKCLSLIGQDPVTAALWWWDRSGSSLHAAWVRRTDRHLGVRHSRVPPATSARERSVEDFDALARQAHLNPASRALRHRRRSQDRRRGGLVRRRRLRHGRPEALPNDKRHRPPAYGSGSGHRHDAAGRRGHCRGRSPYPMEEREALHRVTVDRRTKAPDRCLRGAEGRRRSDIRAGPRLLCLPPA